MHIDTNTRWAQKVSMAFFVVAREGREMSQVLRKTAAVMCKMKMRFTAASFLKKPKYAITKYLISQHLRELQMLSCQVQMSYLMTKYGRNISAGTI